VKEVASHLNQSRGDAAQQSKLREIQELLDGDFMDLVEPHREFVREGALMAMWEEPKQEYQFFLFNDLLLYACKKKFFKGYQYKGFFLLVDISICDLPETEEHQNALELLSLSSTEPMSNRKTISRTYSRYILAAKTHEAKKMWLNDLCNHIILCRKSSLNPSSGNDLFKSTIMQGYMNKRGEINKAWKRRYFMLKGTTLFYFEGHKSQKVLGKIPLSTCNLNLVDAMIQKGRTNTCFELRRSSLEGQRSYYLEPQLEDLLHYWLKALFSVCSLVDDKVVTLLDQMSQRPAEGKLPWRKGRSVRDPHANRAVVKSASHSEGLVKSPRLRDASVDSPVPTLRGSNSSSKAL